MKRYKQINNLIICNSDVGLHNGNWIVKTKDGKILEEFIQLISAEDFCYRTLDFIKKK